MTERDGKFEKKDGTGDAGIRGNFPRGTTIILLNTVYIYIYKYKITMHNNIQYLNIKILINNIYIYII